MGASTGSGEASEGSVASRSSLTAVVFLGFPGVGKTTFADRWGRAGGWCGHQVIDLDPFLQSDVESCGPDKDSAWPLFFDRLGRLFAQEVWLFLPSHRVVRDWLMERGVPFVLFLPERGCKERWVDERIRSRDMAPEASFLHRSWDALQDDHRLCSRYDRCLIVDLDPDTFLDGSVVYRAFEQLRGALGLCE